MRDETQRHRWSSAHLNFANEADVAALVSEPDWLPRFDWQFIWQNQGWRDFGDFLDALAPKKRKNIRQERARVERAGIVCEIRRGDEVEPPLWRAIHAFYLSTFAEKGNHPVLTLPFFEHIGLALRDRVLAVLAWRGSDLIAAALLLRGGDTLFGRYWGCREQIPGLHFEACYYQGIEYCLRHGLQRFEPGAQGEHKLARGFLPTKTQSFHYLADSRFRAAVGDALAREARSLNAYREELLEHSPYATPLESSQSL
jgi:predicted N-acyltransferase